MSYNQFVEFVIFYQTHTNDNQLKCAKNLLSHVKTVRNMSAHSQPIIANLGTPKFDKTNRYLTDKGQTSYKLTYKQVQYKPLRDIFATFYTHLHMDHLLLCLICILLSYVRYLSTYVLTNSVVAYL